MCLLRGLDPIICSNLSILLRYPDILADFANEACCGDVELPFTLLADVRSFREAKNVLGVDGPLRGAP